MITKSTYKRKLFSYFFIVFIVFTIAIAMFQYNREKQYRSGQLESILNDYTEFVQSYMVHNEIYKRKNFQQLDSIVKILPRKDIRITIIDFDGIVLFDSFVEKYQELENHIGRPEVQEAMYAEKGSSIRRSTSTGQDYYYYAKLHKDYFVRAAVVYTINIEEFLKAEQVFLYFIVLVFIVILISLIYVSDRIGKSILTLKDFAIKAGRNENFDTHIEFPDNELGVIGKEISKIYNNLKKTMDELLTEKEKLIHHLQITQEGIAIFSSSNEKILTNNHFIQYLNVISDSPTITPDHFREIKEFDSVIEFIDDYKDKSIETTEKNLPIKKISINKNKRYFDVQCIIFHDKSYEISISDVSGLEKRKLLKQQMTANIAHELRTPISSIKGYLETIIASKNLPPEKQTYFVEKAASQINRLSELIRDISILNKIEEASNLYEIEEVNIELIIKDVIENLHTRLIEKKISVGVHVDESVIQGNKALIYSVFQNLLENAINYGGEGIKISIDKYLEDENNIYFAFSDTGVGIEEEHQARIFERFYRVDKGRSRRNGGTGLGLAIVKNAIQFHKGEITVKTRKGGGIEFLFSFTKKN